MIVCILFAFRLVFEKSHWGGCGLLCLSDYISMIMRLMTPVLDNPECILRAYCKEIGIEFKKEMLCWDTEEDHVRAREAFEKWKGFHEDAINSSSLKPREHVSPPSICPICRG